MRKGISDIIAVVLMIAVAIAIGVFVTNFVTKWVSEQTGSESIACAIKTNYVVEDVRFNYSKQNELLARVTNKGDFPLHSFGFVLDNITRIETFRADNPRILGQVLAGSPLQREESVLLTLNLTTAPNASTLAYNQSAGYWMLAVTAQRVTVTNDACDAVSAYASSVTAY